MILPFMQILRGRRVTVGLLQSRTCQKEVWEDNFLVKSVIRVRGRFQNNNAYSVTIVFYCISFKSLKSHHQQLLKRVKQWNKATYAYFSHLGLLISYYKVYNHCSLCLEQFALSCGTWPELKSLRKLILKHLTIMKNKVEEV